MSIINIIIQNLFAFIIIMSAIVFIHEFGHFIVARACKVKIEEFSIGFGKEIFGFYDRYNTRWKFCWLPFGGYVKMFGDANPASKPNFKAFNQMSEAEKKQSFVFKNVYQRIAIVSAGPIANFILAIIILTFIFNIRGHNVVANKISDIKPNSPAELAELKKGDEIIAINNKKINNFDELRIAIIEAGTNEISITAIRDEQKLNFNLTPELVEVENIFKEKMKLPTIGVIATDIQHHQLNIFQSFAKANIETWQISNSILKTLKELLIGKRSIKELGGPVKIAQYSGKTIELGIMMVLWFGAMISINLGVMNLLPIPMLDGGHLLFYLIEAIIGRPINVKVQEIAFRIGFAILISLMIFTTVNDIVNLVFYK